MLEDGRVHVAGSPGRAFSLGELAAAADPVASRQRGEEPGLGARTIYVDPAMNYPYGVGLGQVEVDPETGGVRLLRYHVAYEDRPAPSTRCWSGPDRRRRGAGRGGALLEDSPTTPPGQPTATSFMDYLVPTASDLPESAS